MGSSNKTGGGLTLRMRHFAEVYDGDAQAAALKAGYAPKSAKSQGSRLLNNENVMAVIRAREAARIGGEVAKREERQRFWSAVMRDETRAMKDRLKAAEQLGRSEGDFFERSEVHHNFPDILPEKLDTETLVFIARGGLRAAVGAATGAPIPAPEGEGDDGDDGDDATDPPSG